MQKDDISKNTGSTNDKSFYLNWKSRVLLFSISGSVTAASFIARVFIELYAVTIGASATSLSFITSTRNLFQQAFQSTFGRISDVIGRKKMIIIGMIGSGVSLAFFPLIQNGWILVVAVTIFSIGFACYTPAFTALLGDLTKRENRASLISLVTLVGAFTSLISLLVVSQLSKKGGSTRMEYLIILEITAGLFILAGLISILLTDPPTEKLERKSVLSFAPLRNNKNFRNFVIISSSMAFFMSCGWPIFPFVRGYYASTQENAYIWASFSIFQILTLLVTKPIIDRISRKLLVFLGRVVMFYIPLNLVITILWVPYWWHMAIGAAISGIGNGFFWVGQNSYVLDSAPEKEKGTYTGLYYLFLGLTTFMGSLLAGVLADVAIAKMGKWSAIVLFLCIITSGRFLASLGFLFIKEPEKTILT